MVCERVVGQGASKTTRFDNKRSSISQLGFVSEYFPLIQFLSDQIWFSSNTISMRASQGLRELGILMTGNIGISANFCRELGIKEENGD